jgi:hypothetical protein
LADKLPLKLSSDSITLGGRNYAATDARVEMIRPNPYNPERYVLVVAATSSTGLQFWSPNRIRNSALDFVIEDGRVPSAGQQAERSDLWLAGGWFDRNWAPDESLVYPGLGDVRAKGLTLTGPLEPSVLDAYVGNFQLNPQFTIKVFRQGNKLLTVAPGNPPSEMIPAGNNTFFIADGSLVVVFSRDASGKVTSFEATRPNTKFTARRVD